MTEGSGNLWTTPMCACDMAFAMFIFISLSRFARASSLAAALAVLAALLTPVGDTTLADAGELWLDTERFQHAIDGCATGHAVVL